VTRWREAFAAGASIKYNPRDQVALCSTGQPCGDRRALIKAIKERIEPVNRIEGDRRVHLDGLRTGNGRELPGRLRTRILRELGRLSASLALVRR
jgi:hypothetical protein